MPAIADLENRLLETPHSSPSPTQEFVKEFLEQPNLNPEEDLFLYEVGGALKAYGLIFPEPSIKRSVLMLKTHSGDRSPEVEDSLIQRALQRATELKADVLHVQAPQDSTLSRLLRDKGFNHVRAYWTMRWNIRELPPTAAPEGCSFRSYGRDGDAETLTTIQNAAFGGSWGFAPNTSQEISYRAGMSITSHEGIIFLSRGESVCGYCWTYIMGDAKRRVGTIFMIGIHPSQRRQRLGNPLLSVGLEYLTSQNVDYVELEVDGANSPATRLYLSTGFRKVAEHHWFETSLGAAPSSSPPPP